MTQKRILIADDLPLDLEQTIGIARKACPSCDITADHFGERVVKWIAGGIEKGEHYDLAILDNDYWTVPQGVKFTQQIRKHDPNIPIILYSASHDSKLKQDFIDAGGNSFVEKGNEEKLQSKIELYLGKPD